MKSLADRKPGTDSFPRHPSWRKPIPKFPKERLFLGVNLLQTHRRGARIVQQRVRICSHPEHRHQVFKHGSCPGKQNRKAVLAGVRPVPTETRRPAECPPWRSRQTRRCAPLMPASRNMRTRVFPSRHQNRAKAICAGDPAGNGNPYCRRTFPPCWQPV